MGLPRVLLPCVTTIWVVAHLSLVNSANAAVIVRESGAFFTALADTEGLFPIDFDGNGTVDVSLFSRSTGYPETGVYALGEGSGIFSQKYANGRDLGSQNLPVPFGVMISTLDQPWNSYGAEWVSDDVDPIFGRAGSLFYSVTGTGSMGSPQIEAGYWRPGDRYACGVRFIGEDGFYHYGWIDLQMEFVSALTVYGWGYETDPNVFVTPFQIPEPGSGVICVIGSLFVIFRRRASDHKSQQ